MLIDLHSIELLLVEAIDALDDNESTLADRVDDARALIEGARRLLRRERAVAEHQAVALPAYGAAASATAN